MASKSRYDHNHTKTGSSDCRATLITQEYARKLKKLDRKFTPDIVGEDSDVARPFQMAQQ